MVAGGYPDHDGGFMSAGFFQGPPKPVPPTLLPKESQMS